MTVIAHLADLHLTERVGEAKATLAEQIEICRVMGQDAASEGASLMLVAGDIFDRASTPAERNAAITIFTRWAAHMPVVVIYGNHDRPNDLDFLVKIRTDFPIRLAAESATIKVAGVLVACLPWPRKAHVARWAGVDSQADTDAAAMQAMQTILRGFAAQIESYQGPTVLLGHVELGGATMDSGQPVAAAADLPLAAGDLLDTGAGYTALGHIHQHQIIQDRICYAGAPRQCTFGESQQKGFCLVDLDYSPPRIRHVQGGGHLLHSYEGAIGDSGELVFGLPRSHLGDAIRLVYTCPADQRERCRTVAEAYRVDLLARGAHSVTIDARVTTVHRVRSEVIRTARTAAEKVEAYWRARDNFPAHHEEILIKLGELEEEVQP